MESRSKKSWLSEHFCLEELTYSRTAVENAIDNDPPPEAMAALQQLATSLLEPLRRYCKAPIAILSGYRSEAVNRLVGGTATSQHLKGEAADCYIPEGPMKLLEMLKQSGLPFDQAIVYKRKRFLHISFNTSGNNRMRVIICVLCAMFLFAGCGSNRKCTGVRAEERTDSAQISRQDCV